MSGRYCYLKVTQHIKKKKKSILTIFPFYSALHVSNYKPVSLPDCKFQGFKYDDLVCR